MNEDEFAAKVTGRLDRSLDELSPEVLGKLRAARLGALAQPESRGFTHWLGAHWKLAAPAFAVIALATGYLLLNWRDQAGDLTLHELEAKLLNHELPPHAFADKGFEQWLKNNPKP